MNKKTLLMGITVTTIGACAIAAFKLIARRKEQNEECEEVEIIEVEEVA